MGRAAVALIGLDIGSTTTSAVVAEARGGNAALSELRELVRSPLTPTPFRDGAVDGDAVMALVDRWLAEAGVDPGSLSGGGALITGLAARSSSALDLADRLRERLGRSLVATARDPRLEARLAFMGNAAELSRQNPGVPFLNLDVGGGTTNVALGKGGEVSRTGCIAIGARHVQLVPGSRRVARLSAEARTIFDVLSIPVSPGQDLSLDAANVLVDVWTATLELTVLGESADLAASPFADLLAEAPLGWPGPGAGHDGPPAIVFSGGVGELVYRMARGEDPAIDAHRADLGVELARGILRSPVLGAHVARWAPEAGARAVAYGLLRYGSSGARLEALLAP